MANRVLHVFPDSAVELRHAHLGSTKDIRGRTEYFESRALPYDELVTPRSYRGTLAMIQKVDLNAYAAVLFENTLSPTAIRFVRNRAPQIRIMARSINAELPHRLDQMRAMGISRRSVRNLTYALTRFYFDYMCARSSDFLLSITDWETEHYWSRFADKRKLKTVPFFLPRLYEDTLPKSANKRLECVCLMSTVPNPFVIDAAKKFASVVRGLGERCGDWSFSITGDAHGVPVQLPARVTFTGFLDSPYDVLARSRAMALLSNYGYGFKTKILEAALCETVTFVPKRLHGRLPREVKPMVMVVDPLSPQSFQRALERSLNPFPGGDPNEALRVRAFAALDDVFKA